VSEEDKPRERVLPPGPLMGRKRYDLRSIRWLVAGFAVMAVVAAVVIFVVRVNTYVTVFGVIIPADELKLHSTIDTTVTEVVAKVGDRVRTGDIVARLYDYEVRKDLSRKQDELAAAKAQLAIVKETLAETRLVPLPNTLWLTGHLVEQARLALDARRTQLARIEESHKEGLTSDWELDAAKTAMQTAEVNLRMAQDRTKIASDDYAEAIVRTAETRVALAETEVVRLENEILRCRDDLDRMVLRAPCAGVVTRVEKRDGEPVARGELVASIARSSTAELKAFVNQAQMFKVQLGQKVQIRSAMYPYRKYGQCYGVVSATNYWATQEGQGTYYEIRVEITETPPDVALKFGSSATARVSVGTGRLIEVLTD